MNSRGGERTTILSNGSPRMLTAMAEAARIRLEIDAGRQGPDVQAAAGVYAVVISVFSTKCCSYPRTGRMGAVVFGFRAAGIDHAKSPDK
jgi:hypothetical protein